MLIQVLEGNLSDSDQVGDRSVDGGIIIIIIECVFRNMDVGYGLDRSVSGKGQLLGTSD
jgi:hypothetical protein